MSSAKTSKDTFEPLKLDTTLLKIDVKTEGDITTKEYDLIPFHPNMADMKDLSNNNYILFPSFIKITEKDLKLSGALGSGQDYKKIFTNLEKFINLIKYVTRPNKSEVDYTLLVDQTQYKNYALSFVKEFTSDITFDFRPIQKYEPLTENEIITNNIGLIKKLFFPVGGHFFVLGHDYLINKSKYVPPYIASDAVNEALKDKKRIPLNYEINIELQLVDATNNPNIGEFSRLSCKAKKNSIKNDFHEIFDAKLGLTEKPKAVLPSLTVPTTTSKRGFGKLQLEWEERNKYVKQALTEKEKLEQEGKKSALHKKMDKFEKKQEEYKKIPPGWINETKALNEKYSTFMKYMTNYKANYEKLKQEKDGFSTTDIDEKMKTTLGAFMASIPSDKFIYGDEEDKAKEEERARINKLLTIATDFSGNMLFNSSGNVIITGLPAFLDKVKSEDKEKKEKPLFNKEQELINIKYVEPFLKDMVEKKKDADALMKEREALKKRIKEDTNGYNKQANEKELADVENRWLKARTDYEQFKTKLGEHGETLTATWGTTIKEMEEFKKTVKKEKTSGEQKIISDSVNAELKKKLEEITKLKKTLYLAKFKEGSINEVTTSERTKFEKEPAPVESVSDIESNLKLLEEDYLEIAAKLSADNKIQGLITLLTSDMNRLKELKKVKDDEKISIDKKVNENIKSRGELAKSLTAPETNDRDRDKDNSPNPIKIKLEAEYTKLQSQLEPRNMFILKANEFERNYDIVIKGLRDYLKDKTVTPPKPSVSELRAKISDEFKKEIYNIVSGDISGGGGGGTGQNDLIQHHTHDLKKKNSKRRLLKLKQLIKTLKRHYKKKKQNYTRRRQQHS